MRNRFDHSKLNEIRSVREALSLYVNTKQAIGWSGWAYAKRQIPFSHQLIYSISFVFFLRHTLQYLPKCWAFFRKPKAQIEIETNIFGEKKTHANISSFLLEYGVVHSVRWLMKTITQNRVEYTQYQIYGPPFQTFA